MKNITNKIALENNTGDVRTIKEYDAREKCNIPKDLDRFNSIYKYEIKKCGATLVLFSYDI